MKNLCLLFLFALSINAQGFICAVGGGSEERGGWSNKPYGWLVEKADSGKVLIISYEDSTNFLPDYFISLGASESYILNIDNSAIADQQSTYDEITSSDGVFIKGGNQYLYYSRMKGTLAHDAIVELFERGGVIGGTSAGAMVLGEFVFTSERASVDPEYAIRNPLGSQITIESDFVSLIDDVYFDTHFIQRGRWGRMIGFIYNVFSNTGNEMIGVGIDDQTAICIDDNLIGTVYGTGAVSIYQIDERTRIVDQGSDYTMEDLKCDMLTENWQFDFNSRTVSHIPSSAREVTFPIPTYYVSTDSYLYGGSSNNPAELMNDNIISFLGENSSARFGIIHNSGFNFYADLISDSLTARGVDHTLIPVSSDLINSPSLADSVNSCDAFLVFTNDLETLSQLGDNSTNVGSAVHESMLDNDPFYYHGKAAKTNGASFVDGTDTSPNASYYGRLEFGHGLANTPTVLFQNDIFEDSDYYENRSTGLLYGMMHENIQMGIYLDTEDYARLKFSSQSYQLLSDKMPIMVVNGNERTHVDSSIYEMSSTANPRQVAAMNNLRYSISTIDKSLNLIDGSLSPLTSVETESNGSPQQDFVLYDNYPNPFNPSTTIKFVVETQHAVSLRVYDALGRIVATLVNEVKIPGTYKFAFDASNLSTGVYFYTLTYGNYSQTKKMLLLK